MHPFVHKLEVEGRSGFLNTLTNTWAPATSSVAFLEENGFMGDEENKRRSILDAYHSFQDNMKIFYVPTWSCNLRCPFCFVLKELEKVSQNEDESIDEEGMRSFLRGYIKHSPVKRLQVSILGGEPFLAPVNARRGAEIFREVAKEFGIGVKISILTNGTIGFDAPNVGEMLGQVDSLQISVDGFGDLHNAVRKPHGDSFDSFDRVVKMMGQLQSLDMMDKVFIHSALPVSIIENEPERLQELMVFLVSCGINPDNIVIGRILPTDNFKREGMVTKSWYQYRTAPCCLYTGTRYLALTPRAAYMNYFERKSKLFDYSEANVEEYVEARKAYLESRIPVLHDKNCLKCPALGRCWGGCPQDHKLKKNPSAHCKQEVYIASLQREIDDKWATGKRKPRVIEEDSL